VAVRLGGWYTSHMNDRTAAVERLLEAIPILRTEGWFLTPFNTWVTEAGGVVVVIRAGDEDLGSELAQRLQDLQPSLCVHVETSQTARHVVFRL
jgi:hypothetical protein